MARRPDTLRDQNGVPIPGALVTVIAYDGSAAILTNDDGSPLANPFPTDDFGGYVYNTTAGRYTEQFSYGGRTVGRDRDVVVGDLIAAIDPSPANGGKYVALDASGVPVYASGTGADAGLRTDLAASGGAALSGFLASGTGATFRTAQDKLRDFVCVRDFGAVGGNSALDTPAINAAIDTGKNVFFPEGHYSYIPSGKTIGFGQTLFGYSPVTTTINKVANGDMYNLSSSSGLYNIGLQGNGSSGGTGRGLVLGDGTDKVRLLNVYIYDMLGYCVEVTANNAASQLQVIGGQFERTDQNQPAFKMPDGDTQASPRQLVGVNTTGVLIDTAGSDNLQITGCRCQEILFGAASKKVIVTGTRISSLGATTTVYGTDNVLVGNAIAGPVVIGAGASNCHVKGNSIANAASITDSSGNTTNRHDYVILGSKTYDPPSLVDGAGTSTTVTATGAALGQFAAASFSLDLQGVIITAYVSAADTVTVRFQNESGGTVDLGSGTLTVRVWS